MPFIPAAASCGVLRLKIKVISMTAGTIIAWIGTTYMATSMYSFGLSLVIASAVLIIATDNIVSWIIGALGAEP
jgi:hypothetical protein